MNEHKGFRSILCIWFSGFFGLGAVGHGIRFLLAIPVVIGGFSIPLWVSAVAAVIMGVLSAALFFSGRRQRVLL